jgi:hypothetical protein
MKDSLTQQYVCSIFTHCPVTGNLLWKTPQRKANPGDIAGYLEQGYRRVELKGVKILAHQLVWLYHFGFIPELKIDHKNGKRADNRLENLQLVTVRQNCQNNARARSGKLVGAYKLPSGRYCSKVRINGKQKSLGSFDSEIEANTAYNQALGISHGS